MDISEREGRTAGGVKDIRVMIVEMARTEPRWGYTSIRDRLRNLGHHVCRATVAKILKAVLRASQPHPRLNQGAPIASYLALWRHMQPK